MSKRDLPYGKTRLGTLQTLTIQDFASEGFEVGEYFVDVLVETAMITAGGDPRGFVLKSIAQHLANSITETTVPSHLWYFETDPAIVKSIPSLPAIMLFGQ